MPALQMAEPVRMMRREASLDTLLAEPAMHRLDLVLADRPVLPRVSARGFGHKPGECAIVSSVLETARESLFADA
jgi:LysR family transcriptional activator of nhaA